MRDEPTFFENVGEQPLAARLRPRTLDEVLGQGHLLAPGKPLREAIERGDVGSMVLWGPPGSGKTTLARILSTQIQKHFVPFSAVTDGVPRVREVIREARDRRATEGRGTLLFCDEIHRFNKAQQDAFLAPVESGDITLVGATTENPSFEINSALLSRLRVFVLEPLDPDDLERIVDRALQLEVDEGSQSQIELDPEARSLLVQYADGDARRVLNATEALLKHVAHNDAAPGIISEETVREVLERRLPRYDKSGEEHFNLISALHKSVRGSDVEGALYWLARMLAGGEDPLYLARRLVRIATEDIGLADPRAASIALSATEIYRFLGSPEGELALAEATVYLATAPKSNRVYRAWGEAQRAAREYPAEPVPLHLRNAPTGLMKELGYGAGYRYDPDEEKGLAAEQAYLPESLRGVQWYVPAELGYEKTVAARLAWWQDLRQRGRGESSGSGDTGA